MENEFRTGRSGACAAASGIGRHEAGRGFHARQPVAQLPDMRPARCRRATQVYAYSAMSAMPYASPGEPRVRGEMFFQPAPRVIARFGRSARHKRIGRRQPQMKRATAMYGSWLYCSKNIQLSATAPCYRIGQERGAFRQPAQDRVRFDEHRSHRRARSSGRSDSSPGIPACGFRRARAVGLDPA